MSKMAEFCMLLNPNPIEGRGGFHTPRGFRPAILTKDNIQSA